MLNLSSYYLFPISLSLSLPSIHLSSALERSLSLFLSKSIFSAVWGLEPYWKHFQCCWLDSSYQAEAETSCRSEAHRPDLQGLPSLPLPQLARLERSNFGNINNAEQSWLSKTSIQAGITRGGAGKEPGKSCSSSLAGNRSTSFAVQFAQRGWQLHLPRSVRFKRALKEIKTFMCDDYSYFIWKLLKSAMMTETAVLLLIDTHVNYELSEFLVVLLQTCFFL